MVKYFCQRWPLSYFYNDDNNHRGTDHNDNDGCADDNNDRGTDYNNHNCTDNDDDDNDKFNDR